MALAAKPIIKLLNPFGVSIIISCSLFFRKKRIFVDQEQERGPMPTYEYECRKCRRKFEIFQNISDKPIKQCPECRGQVRRLIGRGAGVIFKGSGFYQTDYRSEQYKKHAREDKKPAEPSGAKKDSGGAAASPKAMPAAKAKE